MKKYKKIKFELAEDMFYKGYNIFLVPSKCDAYPIKKRMGRKPYIEKAYVANIRNFEFLPDRIFKHHAFDECLDRFAYYNCDKIYGQKVHMYVSVKALDRYKYMRLREEEYVEIPPRELPKNRYYRDVTKKESTTQ